MVIIKHSLNQGNEFIKPKLQSELFGYARKELNCCKHMYFQAPLRILFPPVFFMPHACPPLLPGAEQLASWPFLLLYLS